MHCTLVYTRPIVCRTQIMSYTGLYTTDRLSYATFIIHWAIQDRPFVIHNFYHTLGYTRPTVCHTQLLSYTGLYKTDRDVDRFVGVPSPEAVLGIRLKACPSAWGNCLDFWSPQHILLDVSGRKEKDPLHTMYIQGLQQLLRLANSSIITTASSKW